jgi:hypothetical protein
MTDFVERSLRRLSGQFAGRVSMPGDDGYVRRRRSGRNRRAVRRVRWFSITGPSAPRTIVMFSCRSRLRP